MRLKESEVRSIINVIDSHLADRPYKLFLFGSRTDDHKKGGDVDLLLVVDKKTMEALLDIKGRLRSDLSVALHDQRVDLTLAQEAALQNDCFLASIMPHAILLKAVSD